MFRRKIEKVHQLSMGLRERVGCHGSPIFLTWAVDWTVVLNAVGSPEGGTGLEMYNEIGLACVGLKVCMGHPSGGFKQAVVYMDLKLRRSLGWRWI